MRKELYNAIITIAPEHELAGILRVAAYDPDIMLREFKELFARVNAIKKKCEEIGK